MLVSEERDYRWWTDEWHFVVKDGQESSDDPPTFYLDARLLTGGALLGDPMRLVQEITGNLPYEGFGDGPGFGVRIRYDWTAWGGEVGVVDALLVISKFVMEGAAYDLIKGTFKQLIHQLRTHKDYPGFKPQPITGAEAEARARWHIAERFGVSEDDLTIVSEDHFDQDGSWGFKYGDQNGRQFTCELLDDEGAVVVVHLGWTD